MGGNAFQIGVDGANGGMHFHAGSSEKMTLSANGYLGIGATAPAEKLTVHGNISASGSLSAAGPNNNYFAGNVGIGTSSPVASYDKTLHVKGGNPTVKLETTSSSGWAYNQYKSPENIWSVGIDAPDKFIISNNAALNANVRFAIDDATGYVGIGTTAPAEKLTVHGNISASGSLSASSGYSYLGDRVGIGCSIIPGYGLSMPDTCVIGLGNSGDLQIYHDGNNWIDANGVGNLYLRNLNSSGDVIIQAGGSGDAYIKVNSGETALKATANGAAELYYDDSKKLATTNTGVGIFGTLSASDEVCLAKSVYDSPSGENFYRVKFKDHGGIHNDVGIGQCDQNSMGFNITPSLSAAFVWYAGTEKEKMRLNYGGCLGIGAAAPTEKLELSGGNILLPNNYALKSRDLTGAARRLITYTSGNAVEIGSDASHVTRLYSQNACILADDGTDLDLDPANASGDLLFLTNRGCKVGIGTTAPAEKLTVHGNISASGSLSAAGPDPNYFCGKVGIGTSSPGNQYFNDLVIGNDSSGDKGITVRSNSGNKGLLAFSDADSGTGRYDGYIAYDHSSTSMCFFTNTGSHRMSINGSGQFAMNATSFPSDSNLSVKAIASNQGVVFGENAYPTSLGTNGLSIEGGLRVASTLSAVSGVNVPDSSKITLGDAHDLEIVHNGSYSQINANGTGNLYITQTTADKDIAFQADNGSGSPTTYFFLDGSAVDTRVCKNFRFIDNVTAGFGTNEDFTISHNDTNALLIGTKGNITTCQQAADADILFKAGDGYGNVVDYLRMDSSEQTVLISTGLPASAGKVGIGTSSPDTLLHLEGCEPTLRIFDSVNTLNQESTIQFGTEPGNRTQAEIASINLNAGNAAGGLVFKTNEGASLTERIRIDNNGKVGIGTTAPATKLEISDSLDQLRISDSDGTNQHLELGHNGGSTTYVSRNNSSYGTHVFYTNNGSSTERMRIAGDGKVGIGTAAPTTCLHVDGSACVKTLSSIYGDNNYFAGCVGIGVTAPTKKLEVSSGGADSTTIKASYNPTNYVEIGHNRINAVSSGGNDSLYLQTAGTTRVGINMNGNVGIGIGQTHIIDQKLTVAGNISASGNGYFACVIAGGYFEEKAASPTLAEYPTGSLVVIGCGGNLELSTKSNDKNVFGVTKNGVCQPIVLGAEPVLVTGDINVGDFITTSDTPGHGKKSIDSVHGSIIAQAMEAGCGCSYTLQAMIRKM